MRESSPREGKLEKLLEVAEDFDQEVISSGDSQLYVREYSVGGKRYALLESETFEGMIGFTIDDVTELLEEEYGIEVSEDEIDGMEYENGTVLFYEE